MKKWMIIPFLLLLLLAGGYFIAVKVFLPKTAIAFVPVKWQHIPLGSKKKRVYEYLGSATASWQYKDMWEQRAGSHKKYLLTIDYNTDTVAVHFQVVYETKLLGLVQRTPLQTDSL